MDINEKQLKLTALQLIAAEAREISALKHLVDDVFVRACRLMRATKGRVVVLGMGKSGHIGGKIAASLASTGTPAFFVHPAEALHGDLGMITADDCVLMLSYSGETKELVALISPLKRLQVPIVAITGSAESTLAKYADASLILNISKEACPHNLAPTSSSSATLVLGDALAIALLEQRNFSREDFAKIHPGGALGKKLLTVEKIMHGLEKLPIVNADATLAQTLDQSSSKGLGICFIVNKTNQLVGVFTDGDLRRSIQKKQIDINSPILQLINNKSVRATADILAIDALNIMEKNQITVLAVIDNEQKLIGALHMHDILQAKII